MTNFIHEHGGGAIKRNLAWKEMLAVVNMREGDKKSPRRLQGLEITRKVTGFSGSRVSTLVIP